MKKYKIGFTTGVFDVFHTGHLNLLENCKSMCEYLIVGVCGDDYVRKIKNKEPVFSLDERVRILSALKCVDEVVVVSIEEIQDKMLAIEHYKFDVLFSGDDWKGTDRYNTTELQFKEIGAKIEYFPYTSGVSTTKLKEKMKNL